MKKIKNRAGICLVLSAVTLGTSSCADDNPVVGTGGNLTQIEQQLNAVLGAIAGLLQDLNPFNPPPPAGPNGELGIDPQCPSDMELEDLYCPSGGSATCSPVGPDFQFNFTDCTQSVNAGITITVTVDGDLFYRESRGPGGWPDGFRGVRVDAGGFIPSALYDVDLDGTKDVVITVVQGAGPVAICCADLEVPQSATCFLPEDGPEVCDSQKQDPA
jgi:hypothetical protein